MTTAPTTTNATPEMARFGVNVGSNAAFLVASSALALWYLPFLVDRMGLTALGVVALANALVMYVAVVTDALDVSISRNLTIDIAQDDRAAASRTFNSALAASIGIGAALLVPASLGIAVLPSLFELPIGSERAAMALMAAVLLLVVFDVGCCAYRVPMFALQRFDLRNAVRSGELAVRVGCAVLLIELVGPSLWWIAAGFVAGSLVATLSTVVTARRLVPYLRLHPRLVSRRQVSALLSFGGWSIVNRLGILLFLGADVVLIGLLLGVTATGVYGTLLILPEMLRRLSDTVCSVLSPVIVTRFAVDDRAGLQLIAVRSVTLLSAGLALPIGVLCGLSTPFLGMWLGDDFVEHGWLLVVLVGHLCINLSTLPLSYVLTAHDKVRAQGIATLGLGLVNVVLVVLCLTLLDWGLIGVAAVTGCVFTLRNVWVVARAAARALVLPLRVLLRPLVSGCALTAATAAVAHLLWSVSPVQGWTGLLLVGLLTTLGFAAVPFRRTLTPAERGALSDRWRRLVHHDAAAPLYPPCAASPAGSGTTGVTASPSTTSNPPSSSTEARTTEGLRAVTGGASASAD